ncbi:MAG: sigma-70 family RNA polymerase sigma factor [Lachnospiraceae bacterium]|nr:sigma-70 family RNA polymerase sigma factor [Lachnospiraceae bacterium]
MRGAYEEYYQTVYKFLMGLTAGNHELAEELTQETFYRATKNIGKFRGDSKMSTWLCQIAKYAFYQYIDKKNRQKEVPLETVVDIALEEEVEKSYIQNETKLSLYKKIQELESPMKDVVMLRLTGDLSFREIGDILGKSENWARVTFYRGKQILGRRLENDN